MKNYSEPRNDPNESIDSNGVRWRLIPGCTRYYASNTGSIKSFASDPNGIILTPTANQDGYFNVRIQDWNRVCSLHRLIAMAFISNPDNLPEINHKDCNPGNNNVENLEWCDREFNIAHAMEHGKFVSQTGENSANAVLDENTVKNAYIDFHVNHMNINDIAIKYNVNVNTIRAVVYKSSWNHVTDPLDDDLSIPPSKRLTPRMSEAEASEMYLMHKVRGDTADVIHETFPQYTIKAIQEVIYKGTWVSVTDKLDKKFGFSTDKKIVRIDEDKVRNAYIAVRRKELSVKGAADKYGISDSAMSNIMIKKRWKDLTDKIDAELGFPVYISKNSKPLDEALVTECYKLMKSGYTSREVSNMKGVSNDVLRMMLNKKSWKKVTDRIDLQLKYMGN